MAQPVISTHFPYLPLTLSVRDRSEDLEALLDTGFTGHLVVPAGFLQNGHPADGTTLWTLADGRQVAAPFYHGTIQIGESGPIDVLITELGDEPIVGRSITNRFRIILDHGTRLIVEA